VCGLPTALSVMLKVPFASPKVFGANVIVILHDIFGAIEAPHVLDIWNSESAVIPVITSVAVPELVSVTGCATMSVPTACCPNEILLADSATEGAPPGMLFEQPDRKKIPARVNAPIPLIIFHLPII
jgi:hypothetical protein